MTSSDIVVFTRKLHFCAAKTIFQEIFHAVLFFAAVGYSVVLQFIAVSVSRREWSKFSMGGKLRMEIFPDILPRQIFPP